MVIMEHESGERVRLIGMWAADGRIQGFLSAEHEATGAGILEHTGETAYDQLSEIAVAVYRPAAGWMIVGDGLDPFDEIMHLRAYRYRLNNLY